MESWTYALVVASLCHECRLDGSLLMRLFGCLRAIRIFPAQAGPAARAMRHRRKQVKRLYRSSALIAELDELDAHEHHQCTKRNHHQQETGGEADPPDKKRKQRRENDSRPRMNLALQLGIAAAEVERG